MNKREICKNCKYHYIEEISFDYPQSICNKDEKVGYTTEQGLSCDDFTYSKEYVKTQQQELDKYKNIVDELEKVLNYDINKSTEYMNRFIGEEQGNYSVHYYRAEWQKEKAIGYLDKLKELKGE